MSGIFILSLDTEIAWGTYTRADMRAFSPIFARYRGVLRQLIDLLDLYEVPATWAVVGHLFLQPGEPAPPGLEQPHYSWSDQPDWERAPDSSHPAWYYGPDVIELIRGARAAHEIGTHTYTHVIAGQPAVTPQILDSQLAACVAAHQANGLELRSIVYPWNEIAYTDRLADHGILAYRGEERNWYRGMPGPLGRLGHLLDRALAIPPPTYDLDGLRPKGEVINLPASQFLMAYDGVRRLIPTGARVRQARIGLDRASQEDRLFHLWFHPFNLGTSPAMFEALERILQEVARLRSEDGLRVMTMGQVAEWVLDG
jgi:peptidoglycan/xylan/chitin deacetylase (PgdA/CDA1 family)